MSPQEKMLLYYINAHTTKTGEFVVGRNNIASLLDVSVVTAAKRIENLIAKGYVKEVKKPLARGAGYKWVYHITEKGIEKCHLQWEEGLELYRAHCNNRLIEAIKQATIRSKARGKAIKRHEKQMSLFGDE